MRIKMDEYVEREALSNFILGLTIVDPMVAQYADAVLMHIQQAPAADVVEVRHGKWIEYETSSYAGTDDFGEPKWVPKKFFRCSICRKGTAVRSHFCPNCGARMDKEDAG